MTTTTIETKTIRIPMSEHRPLSIDPEKWDLIARADRHDGVVKCQANHEWAIRVREHADGRRLVYGWRRSGNGGVPIGWRGAEGGYLVEPHNGRPDEEKTVRSIRRVAGIIGDNEMAGECVGDMPTETIE